MKRQKTRQRQTARPRKPAQYGAPDARPVQAEGRTRREALAMIRNWGVVGVLVAGGGWYLVEEVSATIAEHDLSKIGNGTPAIVQIHDPECPRCRELQRETRRALKAFGDDEIQYLVANIRHAEGQALAAAHGVPHVTLLMFDGAGKRRDMLTGNYDGDFLATVFREHLEASAGG